MWGSYVSVIKYVGSQFIMDSSCKIKHEELSRLQIWYKIGLNKNKIKVRRILR